MAFASHANVAVWAHITSVVHLPSHSKRKEKTRVHFSHRHTPFHSMQIELLAHKAASATRYSDLFLAWRARLNVKQVKNIRSHKLTSKTKRFRS